MKLIAPESSGFSLTPAGLHTAIIFRVIDIGTQKVEYEGRVKFQRKGILSWELPHEKMDDGRPLSISKTYTMSLSDKATIVHDLKSWGAPISRDYDLKDLIGTAGNITVIHQPKKDGSGMADRVQGLAPLKKGEAVPAMTNAPVYFSMDEGMDWKTYDTFSESLKARIAQSPEFSHWSKLAAGGHEADDAFPGDA